MRNPVGAKIIAAALAVKRFLAIRTRFNQLRLLAVETAATGSGPFTTSLEDLKWGGYCGGFKHSPYAHFGANATQSMHYAQLSYLFGHNNMPIHDNRTCSLTSAVARAA